MARAFVLLFLALWLSPLCQASPGADEAAIPSPALRGSAAAPWVLRWLPDPVLFYLRWMKQWRPMRKKVLAGGNRSDDDPLWEEAADLIRNFSSDEDTKLGTYFAALCKNGSLEAYAAAACAADILDDSAVDGIPLGAYFCGSTNSGINWTRSWQGNSTFPVKQICNATPGTAHNATGFCGNSTMKELVTNTFRAMPHWRADPVRLNLPSLHCLLGMGNCDIQYCQTCPGKCGPA